MINGKTEKVSEGVTKKVLQPGKDFPCVSKGSIITAAVTGKVTDKKLAMLYSTRRHFWSTKDYGGRPFTFKAGVGQVVQGWDEGVMTMCLYERARINISSEKGYGEEGYLNWKIPPNAGLTFETTILDIKEP